MVPEIQGIAPSVWGGKCWGKNQTLLFVGYFYLSDCQFKGNLTLILNLVLNLETDEPGWAKS